ncbi:MAG: hypothetical protein KKA28_16905 [Planctomycetes bacterium]|nr:hypothetical protein [Planctomycetota bacterium]MCG2682207.1 hypothetical protein [Planctomycetales bacterium]
MRLLAVMLPLLLSTAPSGGEPADVDRLRDDVARLMVELDSDSFEVRVRAAKRLEEMVAKPELGHFLAAEFRRVLLRTDVSFEVRKRLNRLRRKLPPTPAEPVGKVSPKKLDELVSQLDDDSYAVRLGAAERLDWMFGDPKLVYPLMERLKRRLADDGLTSESRRPVEAAWQRARVAWLTGDAVGTNSLPKISDEQIERWLDDLVRPGRPGEAAERELLDLLARDEYVPRLKRILSARLVRAAGGGAAARLQAMLDWTKPAMVAEFWHERRCLGEQHLLVGVPSQSPGAARPSHFDRIDDRVAHCASGNSLSPGDYPVSVAFPHPKVADDFFHLVNLPTPRRRMAYPYSTEIDDSKRLAAISRRTLERVLAEPRLLSESELVMLEGLDPAEVSRFAGKYFLLIDDGSIAATGPPRWGGRPSRFGMICARLAIDGTKDAMPGLAEAISKDRFMPPTVRAPYKLHLIAALSIAARDPWPRADDWLAGCIESNEPLVENGDDSSSSAQLGATAAAILLRRHDRKPTQFGLLPAADPLLNQIKLDGYRFDGDTARKEVAKWWAREKDLKKAP